MQLHTTSTARQVRVQSLESRIADALDLGDATLHRVDFDDLFLSEAAMKALHHIGDLIVKHYRREGREAKSHDFSLHSLTMHAHWVEQSGNLIICAEYGEDIHCVQVPARHWTLRNAKFH
ncbi:MAG: hypothetical protein HQK81_05510 [Desulfovibrionaceae bacterium]|nr:hypothetical protein [Desulfovibrionaceae bacterium]MBF0513505.1 hypothetical protein [Desulfovibrionaceae bacterium]